MIDIRLPNITATTEAGKLQQVQSYMYQLVEQLNWALNNIDSISNTQAQVPANVGTTAPTTQENEAASSFNSIKGFIIKSADIVNAFYEEINKKLEGLYVAEANFPEGSAKYIEKTSAETTANSTNITTLFSNTQTISSNVSSINNVLKPGEDCTTILGASAWVDIGVIGHDNNGFPIYGMEIGQVNEENGVEVYRRFAQYRSDGVHLFDQNGTEVVELSSSRMIIKTSAEFQGSIKHGGFIYIIQTDGSIVTKWVD